MQSRLSRTFSNLIPLNSKGKVTYLVYLSFITEKGSASIHCHHADLAQIVGNLSATGICESEFAVAVMVPFSDRRERYAFASRREGK